MSDNEWYIEWQQGTTNDNEWYNDWQRQPLSLQPSIPWSSSVSLCVIELMAIIHSSKCTVLFSFAVPLLSLAVTHCHSLSLFIVTGCHSLSLAVPHVVIRCHSLYHSLSPLSFVATRCHSLLLVVIQCTTCLSFYKRSKVSSRGFHWSNSFNFSLHRINTVRILWRKKTKSNQRNIHFHLSQLLTLQKLFFYCGVKNHCQQLFVCHEHVFYTKIYLEWDFVLHWKRFCFH